MKKINIIASALIASLAICACNRIDIVPAEPATIAKSLEFVYPDTEAAKFYTDEAGSLVYPMVKGQSVTFSYAISPDPSTLTFPDVEFVSTDPAIVSIDQSGNIKALQSGRATISVKTVTVNTGVTSSILVVVSETLVKATSISITDDAEEWDEETGLPKCSVGETMTLTATVSPDDATYKTVIWSSKNTDIASVEPTTGVVSGLKKGRATIVAETLDGSGVSKSYDIYIDAIIDPIGIKINNLPASGAVISVLETYVPEVVYEPELATKSRVVWTSSDPAVASVDAKGVVTFACPGKVTITAKCPEESGTPSSGFAKEISFSFVVPFGYYRDHCEKTWWKMDTAGAVLTEMYNETTGEKYLHILPAASGTNWRGDFKFYPPMSVQELSADPNNYTFLSVAEYPIICFRLDDINDKVAGANRSIFIDTNNGYVMNSGSTAKIWSGRMGGGGANKWASKLKCSDGSAILIYDISTQSWQNGGMLDPTGVCVFNHFKIGYADIKQAQVPEQQDAAYRFFWLHTFKSMDELNAYLATWSKETGITYE